MKKIICSLSNRSQKILGITLAIAVIIVSFILGSVVVHARNNAGHSDYTPYYTNVTVMQGDTLWSIAEKYIDRGVYDNITDYISQLTKLNHLTSDNIYEGQSLVVLYYKQADN